MIDTCFMLAYACFGCAMACTAMAMRYAVTRNLKAVWADLSGRRRQEDLHIRARQSSSPKPHRLRQGDEDRHMSPMKGANDFRGAHARAEMSRAPSSIATEVGQAPEGERFVVLERLLVCHAADAQVWGGESW